MKRFIFTLFFCLGAVGLQAQEMYGWLLGSTSFERIPGVYSFDYASVEDEVTELQSALYQCWGAAGTNDGRYYVMMSETLYGENMGLYVYDTNNTDGITRVSYTNYGCTDMTYDTTTGWLLGVLSIENGAPCKPFLVVIDPETAEFTRIAKLDVALTAIAANAEGHLIGANAEGTLYHVDRTTGACEEFGALAVTPNNEFGMSLEFDRSTGSLYLGVIEDGADGGALIEVNKNNGGIIRYKNPLDGILFGGLWIPFTEGVKPGEGADPEPWVNPDDVDKVLDVPYNVDFTTAECFDWRPEDVNGDGNTWKTSEDLIMKGWRIDNIYYAADDYLLSQAFRLEAGVDYTVTYTMKAINMWTSENFALTMGNERSAASQTRILDQHLGYTSPNPSGGFMKEEPETFTVTFRVETSGEYVFGMHCTSIRDSYQLEFLNFSIAASASEPELAVLPTPEIGDYIDYTGDSFHAHWGGVEGATEYLLSVYTDGDIVQKHVALNTPQLPSGITSNVTYNADHQGYCLENDGDYVEVALPEGQFHTFLMRAMQYDNDGVNSDNSTAFRIDLMNAAGESIVFGDGNGNYFTAHDELNIFNAFGTYIPEISIVRISLVADGARSVGKLCVKHLDYTYPDAVYVLEKQAVSGTDMVVEGLNPELTYFYNIRARAEGAMSHKSADKCVDGFLAPVVLGATDITATSYTAHWNETPKALDYDICNYLVENRSGADDAPIFRDDFNGITVGTIDSPLEVSSLDGYTAQIGWQGNKMCVAEGMIGTTQGSTAAAPRNYNFLKSPVMDLSSADGVYTIHAKFRTQGKAETISVYNTAYTYTDEAGRPQLNIHTVDIPASGECEATWTMTDGMADMRLSFEPKKLNAFFIDEITITQVIDGETVVYTLVGQQHADDSYSTECTFNGLIPGATYAYQVTAHRYDYYGYEQNSKPSDYQHVVLEPAPDAITNVQSATPLVIYDLQGRRADAIRDRVMIVNGRKVIMK